MKILSPVRGSRDAGQILPGGSGESKMPFNTETMMGLGEFEYNLPQALSLGFGMEEAPDFLGTFHSDQCRSEDHY